VELRVGSAAQEGSWYQSVLSRVHRASPGILRRQGAGGVALDSRNQIRRLSRPGSYPRWRGEGFTRRGNDWTKRFRKIASDASEIDVGSAILNGEVVVPSASGVSDFSVLQNELKGRSTKIVLVAFDLLYLNGHDLRKLSLLARKAELRHIIDGTAVQFSESFEIDGQDMYQHACKLGLEGVVSKVRDSAYVSGRGNIWVKKTCQQRETLTIAGFALDGQKWDGIYLGRRKGKDLIYAGKVDHGFDNKSAADLRKRLTPLIRKTQPYTKRIAHRGIWVEPQLLAEIEYRAKSAEGKVRHPFFLGLREDI
jgi:bifunctional non-homologous end joining protein LigD